MNHEYGLFYARSSEHALVGHMAHTEKQRRRYDEVDEVGDHFEWENFRKSSAGSYRVDRPRQFFPIFYDKHVKLLRVPFLRWQDVTREWKVMESPSENEVAIWPKDSAGKERVWRYGVERTKGVLKDAVAREGDAGFELYTRKYLQTEGVLPRTWWDKPDYSARDNGTRALADLFGPGKPFDFPKAPAAVMDSLKVCCRGEQALLLDYFAGSGTTGHAVINLNREDGGRRKFILVEMADYFDTVLLPRLKKVTFTPEWKDGQPSRLATAEEADRGPRLMKVIRLESYEDALNNIAFDEPVGQQALKFEDYLLKYMLKWESKHSETLLNVGKLTRPFAYQLHLHRDGETRAQPVDLPETFNYLLGLHVQTRRVYDDNGRRYLAYRGTTREGRKTVVIWRDTAGWEQADYERDKQFVAEQSLAVGADELYVNGDSFIPGARALEPLFKARLFAPVEG